MKVFITGGTGFVGSHIVKRLLKKGHKVVLLVRPGSEHKCPKHRNLRIASGDVFDKKGLSSAMEGCDAVIHLVGIIREHKSKGITFERLHDEAARNAVASAEHAGIRRFVHMSALGTRAQAESMYHETKYRGELAIKAAHLDWTIFRPSVIFGPEDRSINLFAKMMHLFPVFPMFGRPDAKIRPVFVEDVAHAFARALTARHAVGKTYELCGPQEYTYAHLFKTIAKLIRRRILVVRIPFAIGWSASSLLGWIPFFPMTKDQFIMINEDNTCKRTAARKTAKELGVKLFSLEEKFPTYSPYANP